MNRLYIVFRAAFVLVFLCILLIPSIAIATSENVTSTEIDASPSIQISVPELLWLFSVITNMAGFHIL